MVQGRKTLAQTGRLPDEETELRIWENQGGESSQSRVIEGKVPAKNSGDIQRELLSIQQSIGL